MFKYGFGARISEIRSERAPGSLGRTALRVPWPKSPVTSSRDGPRGTPQRNAPQRGGTPCDRSDLSDSSSPKTLGKGDGEPGIDIRGDLTPSRFHPKEGDTVLRSSGPTTLLSRLRSREAHETRRLPYSRLPRAKTGIQHGSAYHVAPERSRPCRRRKWYSLTKSGRGKEKGNMPPVQRQFLAESRTLTGGSATGQLVELGHLGRDRRVGGRRPDQSTGLPNRRRPLTKAPSWG